MKLNEGSVAAQLGQTMGNRTLIELHQLIGAVLDARPELAEEPVLIQSECMSAEGVVSDLDLSNGPWLVFARTDDNQES